MTDKTKGDYYRFFAKFFLNDLRGLDGENYTKFDPYTLNKAVFYCWLGLITRQQLRESIKLDMIEADK